ncbi:hypothetical protein ACFLXV_02765, partial [Chloroflexota bacterium]
MEEHKALITVDQETEKMEAGHINSPIIQLDSENMVDEQTETTWRWNRKKKAWVEIVAKLSEAGSPDDIGDANLNGGDGYHSSSHLSAPADRVRLLKSVWRRSPIRVTASRVVAVLSAKDRIEESHKLVIKDAEVQAERIIAVAEDRARALADRIVIQAEQRAEERVESIITRAEETALEKAINIIVSAEERAEALAEHIIARAEELAQAKVENIIALTGDKEQQQSTSVIPVADRQSNAQTLQTIADTKEMQRQIRAATGQQAEQMLNRMADNKFEELMADVAEEVRARPSQSEPLLLDAEHDEQDMPRTGTVELVVEPPVNYGVVKTMLKRMKMLRGIKVIHVGGSAEKGVRIKLRSV